MYIHNNIYMIIYVYYRYFRYIHIYIYALYTCICMYISFSDKVFGLPITTLDCHCGCSFQAFKSWDFYSWRSNIIVLCGYHGDIYPLFTYVIAFQQCFLYHLPFLKKDTVQKWRKVVAVFFLWDTFQPWRCPSKILGTSCEQREWCWELSGGLQF